VDDPLDIAFDDGKQRPIWRMLTRELLCHLMARDEVGRLVRMPYTREPWPALDEAPGTRKLMISPVGTWHFVTQLCLLWYLQVKTWGYWKGFFGGGHGHYHRWEW
jgi:hypothetical protein